ncbi:MAG: ABC transporter permease subunit [Myxococcales bacterium]|nr:ABC transporter permease subunit [Myxococcales bacterium]
MRHALRRLLWLLPGLMLISLLGFWAVSKTLQPTATSLPRFFNPNPVSVRNLAEKAMADAAQGERAGARELRRLGGAALPYVLPKLDTLSPTQRTRVALALAPLGRRMGVGEPEELDDPEAAVVFWSRFWQDRGLDYRPLVVRRAVSRLASKSSTLRRADVLALDTYALPELFTALALPTTDQEVPRARRLVAMIAHITERSERIPRVTTLSEAQAVVREYREWWRQERASYIPREGTDRVLAMFRDTQYGEWLTSTIVYRSDELLRQLAYASVPSLRLAGWAVFGSLVLAVLLLALPVPRGRRYTLFFAFLASSPLWFVLVWTGSDLGALAMALFGGIRAASYARALQRQLVGAALDQAERGFGLSPLRRRLRHARLGLGYAIADLPLALPGIFSAALLVELATRQSALGTRTLQAIRQGDIGWVMVLLVALTALVALAQLFGDYALGRLDPRLREALRRREGRVA